MAYRVKVFLEGKEERLLPHSNVVTKVKIIVAQDSGYVTWELVAFLNVVILEKYFLRGNRRKSNETRPKTSVLLEGSQMPIL